MDIDHKDLVFVGWTNGSQILYGAKGEGLFFGDNGGNCIIPLYMLKTHQHRIETTSNMQVTLDKVKSAQKWGRVSDG